MFISFPRHCVLVRKGKAKSEPAKGYELLLRRSRSRLRARFSGRRGRARGALEAGVFQLGLDAVAHLFAMLHAVRRPRDGRRDLRVIQFATFGLGVFDGEPAFFLATLASQLVFGRSFGFRGNGRCRRRRSCGRRLCGLWRMIRGAATRSREHDGD